MVPQLDSSFYSSQIFWLVVCLAILVFAFKKIFIPNFNEIMSKRNGYITSYKKEINQLKIDIDQLENKIKLLNDQKVQKTTKIIDSAIKKADILLEEQLEIIKKENEGLISGKRSRLSSEILNLESSFKLQIDIVAQTTFQKLLNLPKIGA